MYTTKTKIITPEVLYQDQDIWVINKPAGWVVNEADTTKAPTIQWWWQQQRPPLWPAEWARMVPTDFDSQYGTPESIFAERAGIVHRLDKDTSGTLVLACHPGSLIHLLAQFKKRQTTKKYLALVHGKFNVPEALIDAPLGRASHDRKVFAVRADGRPAQTRYRVLHHYREVDATLLFGQDTNICNGSLSKLSKELSIYQGFSLVECEPMTGRTHQIRVHMAHVKHPLVGDTAYVGRRRAKLDPLWCPRQFLHAASLTVIHPRTGEQLTATADVPADLMFALELLIETE